MLNFVCVADYRSRNQHLGVGKQYDPDAFDSMAVMNSEIWNLGEGDEGELTPRDLLPNVRNLLYNF